MQKAVIFDMDGVLVDSELGYNHADAAMFSQLGLPFGPREIAGITGTAGVLVARIIKGWYPDLPETEEELVRMYMDGLFHSLSTEVHSLIDGVENWLKRLKAMDVKLAIASSSDDRMVHLVADRFSLRDYMEVIVTGDDVALTKPEPDLFLLAAEKLGVRPADCLVFEDSKNGIAAARAAHMTCAAYTGTNRHGMDLSAADWQFPAFDDASWPTVEDWLHR